MVRLWSVPHATQPRKSLGIHATRHTAPSVPTALPAFAALTACRIQPDGASQRICQRWCRLRKFAPKISHCSPLGRSNRQLMARFSESTWCALGKPQYTAYIDEKCSLLGPGDRAKQITSPTASMFPPQISPSRKKRPTWWGAVQLVAGSMLFWALAAGILFVAAPGVDSFRRLLVFSECVGMVILVFAMLLRPSRWFPKIRPTIGWLVTGVIAIPAGYVVGHVIALIILGEPFRLLSPGNDRMVPIIFTVLIAGFGLHYFATREHLANEAMARSEAQRLATESQLRLLRAQLEPHMLFNTLANLRSLIKEDTQQAEVMIDQLIVYLRSALAASRTEANTLRDEFTQLHAYLEIMALRMGSRLSYRLDLPADLEQMAVPSMLLQPLVENAIKHGIEPKVGAGSIHVSAQRTNSGVEISVNDTGLGLAPGRADWGSVDSANSRSGSYGLLHVRERLKASYGPQASLTLTPQLPAGVCAKVRIPQ